MDSQDSVTDLDARIRELEVQEREISARRKRLHERLAFFPSELGDQQEREISAQRRELHRELDLLRVERNRARDDRAAAR